MNRTIRRFYSRSSFLASDLEILLKPSIAPNLSQKKLSLEFGKINTDHMVEILYTKKNGWNNPRIIPFQNLSIHPFNSTFHYAISAFDGMKAYHVDKHIRLFRPEMNINRFLESAKRLSFPLFETSELLKIIEQYVLIEKNWIPKKSGTSLYLRPLLMSMTNVLGVHAPEDIAIYVMACPVGEYFSNDLLNLKVCEDYWRGTPKSAAGYKLACNYGPTIMIAEEMRKQGYSQALWAFQENFLESGASNMFFLRDNGDHLELVTHPLDNSILPGVTRMTILELMGKLFPEIKVSVRPYSFTEFINDHQQGNLKEAFACGTAAIIGAVNRINLREKNYDFVYNDSSISKQLKQHILDIQEGRINHHFSHVIKN